MAVPAPKAEGGSVLRRGASDGGGDGNGGRSRLRTCDGAPQEVEGSLLGRENAKGSDAPTPRPPAPPTNAQRAPPLSMGVERRGEGALLA
eukprot:137199-Pleurochrysis_carterae.AAC.1